MKGSIVAPSRNTQQRLKFLAAHQPTMLITVAGFKGGVGKTTVSIHLAASLNHVKPTLLIDCDPNQSALLWSQGGNFDFPTVILEEAQELLKRQKHPFAIADTKAREGGEEMLQLAKVSDLIILPTKIGKLDVFGLVTTIKALRKVSDVRYKVLLTMTPPMVSKRLQSGDTQLVKNQRLTEMREFLEKQGVPVFNTEIQHYAAFEQAPECSCLAKDFPGKTPMKAWALIHSLAEEVMEELNV